MPPLSKHARLPGVRGRRRWMQRRCREVGYSTEAKCGEEKEGEIPCVRVYNFCFFLSFCYIQQVVCTHIFERVALPPWPWRLLRTLSGSLPDTKVESATVWHRIIGMRRGRRKVVAATTLKAAAARPYKRLFCSNCTVASLAKTTTCLRT